MVTRDDPNRKTHRDGRQIHRRRYLAAAGAVASVAAVAGCTFETDDSEESDDPGADPTMPGFFEIEDKPDAVYLPTHREAMRMLEPVEVGAYSIAPMLSYPHPFWIVSGDEIEAETPDGGPGVHFMMSVWDTDTGTVLPVDSGVELRLEREGETVGSPRSPWTMLSQQMGFHLGDNVPLADDGTYTAAVTLPPLDVRTTGELEGKFQERETVSFEFEYDQQFREEVVAGVEYLSEDEWGEPGALEPMGHGHGDHHDEDEDHHDEAEEHHSEDEHESEHENGHDHGTVPFSELPPADSFPGTHLEPADGDRAMSGDAVFVATVLESGSRFVDADERYLLVSPRTPYNRVPLADMSIQAIVDGDDDEPLSLVQTIDDEYGLHYGTAIGAAEIEDVTLEITTIPQVARHQGYDTAFVDMPPIELTIPESGE